MLRTLERRTASAEVSRPQETVMERLARIGASYFRWIWDEYTAIELAPAFRLSRAAGAAVEVNENSHDGGDDDDGGDYADKIWERYGGPETSQRLRNVLSGILLWENSVNSASVLVIFNVFFWGIVALEMRGLAAACCAALGIVLCYSALETPIKMGDKEPRDDKPSSFDEKDGDERIEKAIRVGQRWLRCLRQLRKNQPGAFCLVVCSAIVVVWVVGRTINEILLAYTICMTILVGPVLLLKVTDKTAVRKEWDSEIEEFLPAVTENNLLLLRRAGEWGDQSPTPTSALTDVQNEFFDDYDDDDDDDDDLACLQMPSLEDGSTDGVELSELELSVDENDGIRFQSSHFEKSSSSSSEEEEEAELEADAGRPFENDDGSDEEFEIIDERELANLDAS